MKKAGRKFTDRTAPLYPRVSKTNHTWATAMAKRCKISRAELIDNILTQVRKNPKAIIFHVTKA